VAKHFKDLIAWQKAMDLVSALYDATEAFPKHEIYSLTNQMRRAAVSVPSNIAEGRRATALESSAISFGIRVDRSLNLKLKSSLRKERII
jgi:four helix bundle protein